MFDANFLTYSAPYANTTKDKSDFPLLTTYYSPLTTYYSLLTTHYSLITTYRSPFTTNFQPRVIKFKKIDKERLYPGFMLKTYIQDLFCVLRIF